MKFIDLHTHTEYSDGTSTVENSLRCANGLGLSIFSVSDHNTVDAYDKILEKRNLFSGSILPAVELATMAGDQMIEILGYGFDVPKMKNEISKKYYTFYEKQIRGARLDVLATLRNGAILDDSFITTVLETPERIFDPHHESNRAYLLGELRRHPENARFFRDQNEFETIAVNQFSNQYLFNPQSPLFSDQSALFPTIEEVLNMIHACGGLAFLAHVFIYADGFVDRLDEVVAKGLDGLECQYGTFTAAQRSFLSDYCDANNLYKSGGSDFHGLDMRPQNRMGYADGEQIPQELIEPWLPLVKKSLI